MEYWFDRLEYKKGSIIINGWTVPQTPGKPLEITITDQKGRPVAVTKQQMIPRSDVGMVKFHDPAMNMYGYYLEIPYTDALKMTLRFRVANEPEEVQEVTFSPVKLKYLKSEFSPANLLKAAGKIDYKNFWRLRKAYLHGGKERHYNIWREMHCPDKKELAAQRAYVFRERPLISIVIPVYKPQLRHIKAMIRSVQAQTYDNWELCLAFYGSKDDEIGQYLRSAIHSCRKIKVKHLKDNYGIAGNTNKALEMAAGDWIAFADQDDLIREDTLFEYVKTINFSDVDVIYCDEDKLDDETGMYFEPHFKPDFNIDLLRCGNYVCHMLAVRKELAKEVGPLKPEMDGAQDFDFTLRLSEKTKKFAHVSKVLYGWRSHRDSTALNPESKMYAFEAGVRALQQHYARIGIDAEVDMMKVKGWYRTRFHLKETPLVSVIIPNKDHSSDLTRCIESIRTKASYQNYEILIVENNSTEEKTFRTYEKLQEEDSRIRVITWPGHGFNYAAINNYAVEQAKGEYLLLLNNDTEVITEDLFESMLGYCMREDVGAVGARMFFEDETVQHAGIVVGVTSGAEPLFVHYNREEPGYMGRAIVSQDLTAVTAACMMVKTSLYREVGGMEAAFAVAYNDVDFCLKLRDKNYLVVYDAFAELYHYESQTRGYDSEGEDRSRLEIERELLCRRWPNAMHGDPYYNRNLSLENGYYVI